MAKGEKSRCVACRTVLYCTLSFARTLTHHHHHHHAPVTWLQQIDLTIDDESNEDEDVIETPVPQKPKPVPIVLE